MAETATTRAPVLKRAWHATAPLVRFAPERFAGRRLAAVALALAAVVVAAVTFRSFDLSGLTTRGIPPDGFTLASIEQGFNFAFCGKYSIIYSTTDLSPRTPDGRPAPEIRRVAGSGPDVVRTPIRAWVERDFGSIAAYCALVRDPFVHGEMGVFVVYSALLYALPDASLLDLARIWLALRLLLLAGVAYTLLRLGVGPLFVAGFVVGAVQFDNLLASGAALAQYPLAAIQLAALVSLMVLGRGWGERRGWSFGFLAAFGAAIGLAAFFVGNMRTSQGMIALAAVGFYTALIWFGALSKRPTKRWLALLVFAAAAAGAFSAANKAILLPLPQVESNFAYHPIAHPLVLGLSEPPSDLARREGIRWDDSVGEQIALRVDPQARYLGPRYEPALWTFYRGLWRDHTGEMVVLHLRKMAQATTVLVRALVVNMPPPTRYLAWPLVPPFAFNGWIWFAFVVGLACLGLVFAFRRADALVLALALYGGVGTLLTLEHAIIYPVASPAHFGALTVWLLLACMGLVQAAAFVGERLWERRKGSGPAAEATSPGRGG